MGKPLPTLTDTERALQTKMPYLLGIAAQRLYCPEEMNNSSGVIQGCRILLAYDSSWFSCDQGKKENAIRRGLLSLLKEVLALWIRYGRLTIQKPRWKRARSLRHGMAQRCPAATEVEATEGNRFTGRR
ncbi:hypothetical protein BIW11_02814 [Tropilaelaps mercedesae]|uniref:Uncharacterized protein n=1 Tax=Tropilaelaps mercedesae TaxID=418985 RepID=A0A1V9XWY1_9ACAR|nr:hypothetical protein BIW11_02814 [Tropilaelaps mercedesae]